MLQLLLIFQSALQKKKKYKEIILYILTYNSIQMIDKIIIYPLEVVGGGRYTELQVGKNCYSTT